MRIMPCLCLSVCGDLNNPHWIIIIIRRIKIMPETDGNSKLMLNWMVFSHVIVNFLESVPKGDCLHFPTNSNEDTRS